MRDHEALPAIGVAKPGAAGPGRGERPLAGAPGPAS